MNPAAWGGLSALSLGSADFAARFSSRALGPSVALFGMLMVGSIILSLWVWISGTPLVWEPSGFWLLVINGIATMAMTLCLYTALGPRAGERSGAYRRQSSCFGGGILGSLRHTSKRYSVVGDGGNRDRGHCRCALC